MNQTIPIQPGAKYRPQRCNYCGEDTWCDMRVLQSRTIAWQCRGCRVVRFFRNVLYKPFGYDLMKWQHDELRILYGTVDQFTGLRQYRKAYESVAKQNGKALDLATPIPRPGGWSSMGDIRVGASVLSEKMRPIQVTAKSDVDANERAFELRFSDGTAIVAGARHQWLTRNNREPARIWTSLEMFEQQQSSFRIARAARDGMAGEHSVSAIAEVAPRPMQCIEVDSESHLYLAGESMVPTHNSFLVGGLPIYHIVVEVADEVMPEAFGIASATDQAKITFDAAKLFVDNNPRLKQILDVRASRLRIVRKDGRGVYRVLAAEGKTQDGKRPSLLLFDELHRFTRKGAAEVHSVLIKGQISRKEPLMVETTTSGDEQESKLWFDEYENAQHILDGSLVNPRFHAAIWQADPKRIIKDPEYWKSKEARVAANPSHEDNGGFLKDADIEENLNDALTKPEKKGGYIRLNLNVPFSMSETPAIDMAQWYEGGGGVDLREWATYDVQLLIKKWGLIDRPCIVGVDLAWSIDMTALACLFPPTDDFDNNSIEQWKVLMFYWLPEKRRKFFETRTRAPLNDWMERKFIDMVPGYEVHAKVIEDKIKWAAEMFDMRELTFDKWGGMRAIGQKLSDEEGMTAIDIRQGFATISAPTKEFLAMHMANRIAHGNNPILNWNASCLAIVSDGADNIKPSKPDRTTASKRIDGCAAIITALARAMLLYKPESVYASRGPLVVE